MEKGLIHIYTGDGKGKTTATVGLSLRAIGHGLKVCYANFNKAEGTYVNTEVDILKKLGAKIIIGTSQHPTFNSRVSSEEQSELTHNSLKNIDEVIHDDNFDMLLLDEILISVRDGFLKEDTLINFIRHKPQGLELVMTGRGATEKIIALADYVSEINAIKHPFNEGILGREGIEF